MGSGRLYYNDGIDDMTSEMFLNFSVYCCFLVYFFFFSIAEIGNKYLIF